jgi:hypothetical protein
VRPAELVAEGAAPVGGGLCGVVIGVLGRGGDVPAGGRH